MDFLNWISIYVCTVIATACALLSLFGLKLDIIGYYCSLSLYWKTFLVLCADNGIVFSVALMYFERRLKS
jgi:hypothetical protein